MRMAAVVLVSKAGVFESRERQRVLARGQSQVVRERSDSVGGRMALSLGSRSGSTCIPRRSCEEFPLGSIAVFQERETPRPRV